MSLTDIIFSGAFERYPKLQVGSVEHELSWVPHFLDRMNYTYSQRVNQAYKGFKDGVFPSDYFHSNVFLGFQEDALGIKLRDMIGVDNLQWGADYPHPESTFPRSQQILEEILVDCTEEEKAKIVGGNAARIYAGIPQIKPTFLEIAPSGIPSNIIPHSKGVKCGLIRSNSPFSYSNHRPAKPKIPKPLVYAQVSPLGTSFATP